MAKNQTKLPRSASSLKIKRAVKGLKAMPVKDRIQLLVKASLMTQQEADRTKRRLHRA